MLVNFGMKVIRERLYESQCGPFVQFPQFVQAFGTACTRSSPCALKYPETYLCTYLNLCNVNNIILIFHSSFCYCGRSFKTYIFN